MTDRLNQGVIEELSVCGDPDKAALARDLLAARRELEEKEGEIERLTEERAAALSVRTKEGWLASEWVLRTGLAEQHTRLAELELAAAQAVIEAARGAAEWFEFAERYASDGPYEFNEEGAALHRALRAYDAAKEPKP